MLGVPAGDSFAFIFPNGKINYGVAAIELAASNSPPDCCILIFESRREAKKPTPEWVLAFLVTRRGFEPRTHCLKGSCSAN